MKILQVNTSDVEGGAAVIARNLMLAYQDLGHQSFMAVGRKESLDDCVSIIPKIDNPARSKKAILSLDTFLKDKSQNIQGLWRLRQITTRLSEDKTTKEIRKGWENFNFPDTYQLLNFVPEDPDIIHLHNLHGGYFDLRALPTISEKVPTIITLHDMWLLTGHCAHSMSCDRWRTGCGQCPDLEIYPDIKKDATAFNLRRKKRIYKRSRLYVATPSQWLMDQVQQSILQEAVVEGRVINNGVDTTVFSPSDKNTARKILNLPVDAQILVFVAAHHTRNHPFKDFDTIEKALEQLQLDRKNSRPLIFLALGAAGAGINENDFEMRFLPYVRDRNELASIYQAADLYIHAAKADTFPNSILEALACGTPVIATGVGGIPEQIEDGVTGYVTQPADPDDMALAISHVLNDEDLLISMGKNAIESVNKRFKLSDQVDAYLSWYHQILEEKTHALS